MESAIAPDTTGTFDFVSSFSPRNSFSLILKRYSDLTVAAMLLFLFAPVLALIAFVVSLDGGPVIYRHRRIGLNGVPFDCLKFRTMIVGADTCLTEYLQFNPEHLGAWETDQKLALDPRVTGLGTWLRRLSLDELPQLANVLFGEMSLVGPRPVTMQELEERYRSLASAYLSVRPGVTGLWQISGRNDVQYDQRVLLDCQYVARQSLKLDMVILFRTAGVVVARRGAR